MKVLLANIPWIDNAEYYGLRAGSRWPHLRMKKEHLPYYPFPFWLSYGASILKKEGYSAILKDCIAEGMPKEEFIDWLKRKSPDIVVIETATASIYNDLELTKRISEEIETTTVLCGPHVTALPHETLENKFVNFVIIGEYEYALKNLVDKLDSGKDTSKLNGVCFREGNKTIINPRAPLIDNLDELPFPIRDSLPMEKYIDPFCKHAPNAQMISSRGCPNQCSFCLEPLVYGKKNYRMRSPENVVDEMEYLVNNYKVKEIYFDDSSFSVNRTRVDKICQEILDRGLDIYWSCMADSNLRKDTLKKMNSAGCIALKFGVETSDIQILKNINKPFSSQDAKSVVEDCKKVGIETHATFIFGLPGETSNTINKTMKFAFDLGTETAQFSSVIPFPGTGLFETAKKNNWLVTDDWSKYDGQNVILEYPGLSCNEVSNAVHKARKKIFLRVATNPRQFLQYSRLIHKYSGYSGLINMISEKMRYLLWYRP
jgi:radical SAM superfamily enzyme YgiQ (UPF0313 family)